jgi:hypothetical protein
MENKDKTPQEVDQKTQEEAQKPLTLFEKIEKAVLKIPSNKKVIADIFKEKKLQKIKVFVVQSKEKTRENYYEIFFDFGALNQFAQMQKNISSNKDSDLVDSGKESKDFFKKLFYEVYEVKCIDISEENFELTKTTEKLNLENLDSVKK